MKLSTSRDALFAQLQTVTRAVSTRSAIQALSGVKHEATASASSSRRPTWRSAFAFPSSGGGARRRRHPPRPPDPRRRPRASERHPDARGPARRAGRRDRRRQRHLPHPHPSCRGLPAVPVSPAEGTVSVPAEAFVETITRVARSASRDENRGRSHRILVSASGQELRMVATDSYRLSVKETQLEQALDGSFEANVPARALQELARMRPAAGNRAPHRRRPGEPDRLRVDGPCSRRASSTVNSRTTASCCPMPTSTNCGSPPRKFLDVVRA